MQRSRFLALAQNTVFKDKPCCPNSEGVFITLRDIIINTENTIWSKYIDLQWWDKISTTVIKDSSLVTLN